jgi:Zn-dependent protease with chaperone function
MISLFAPLAVAAFGCLIVAALSGRLRPEMAARLMLAATALVTVILILSSWVLALVFLGHAPLTSGAFAWCSEPLGVHGPLPVWLGGPSLLLALWASLRCARSFRDWASARRHGCGGVEIIDSANPVAFTAPGPAGLVVVSNSLLAVLDSGGRAAVFAHEASHARHRHDRYLLVAGFASATVILEPLARSIRFACERWADEEAAARVGDRRIVARALGRTALASTDVPQSCPAMFRTDVTARVEAMLAAPLPSSARLRLTGASAALVLVAVAVGSSVQLHHIAQFVSALCPT